MLNKEEIKEMEELEWELKIRKKEMKKQHLHLIL